MKCILEEYEDIQKAEDFINDCLDSEGFMPNATIIPYAKTPYLTHYVVAVYKADDETNSGTLGFKS